MRWFIIVALALNVVVCGQKGPLELPEQHTGSAAFEMAANHLGYRSD